jgi:succinate dehydrogenase / fumarate reductase cytochrome b subunit
VKSAAPSSETPWLVRHDFLLRRLHSLSGLVPVGAYMVIHLLTNASVLDAPATYQENVYRIHSLGRALVLVEWGFIFLPLIFHAVFGVIIIRGGLPNNHHYPYVSNLRYTLQRVSGMIAFVFIFWHVFHMHGWFHGEAWLTRLAEPLGGARFRPFNAASSLALALQGFVVPALYAIGMLASVFHLANGIWTMGITWGVWISPTAQRRASWICLVAGVGLAIVGLSALTGARAVPIGEALETEQRMYDAKVTAQQVQPERAEHKRWSAAELESLHEQLAQPSAIADQAADSAETQSPIKTKTQSTFTRSK